MKRMFQFFLFFCAISIVSGFDQAYSAVTLNNFAITSGTYAETDNLEQSIRNQFGSNYRIADWNDIVAYNNNGGNAVAFETALAQGAYITYNGSRWSTSTRHYLYTISHRPGQTPHDGYLSHANIDNHEWDLGSWYGQNRVLAYTDNPSTGADSCGAYLAPGVWKEFDCYNLAAIGKTTEDDPFSPSWRLIGGYWQWGRKGPDHSQWHDTNTPYFAHGPTGPGSEDANDGSISGWDSSNAPTGAWSDSHKTDDDPCPVGFRVPTKSQWNGVLENNTQSKVGSWSSNIINYSSARFFGDKLMLPAAGFRDDYSIGNLGNRGGNGYYWSSSESSASGYAGGLIFGNELVETGYYSRYGYSVRCVIDSEDPPPCTYSISLTNGSFNSGGGSSTVSVSASSSNCTWTTSESLSWISLSPTSGTGSRSVTVSVTDNSGVERSGSITIAGKTYSITQSAPCTYSISPTNGNFPASGGTDIVRVSTSDPDCTWTASESLYWVTLSQTSGSGNGDVTITVNPNTGDARNGSATIAGRTYAINQAGAPEKAGIILTKASPNHTITSSSDVKVYGTAVSNQITLESGAKAELINFPGFNTVQFQSSADGFSVSRSGQVVTFQGTDGTVLKIPASQTVQTIAFAGQEPLTLSIYNNQVMLDDQEITSIPASVKGKQSDVVIDAETSTAEIAEVSVNDDETINLTTSASGSLGENLSVGSVAIVPPGVDDRFPFGVSGYISSVNTNPDGSVTAKLEATTLSSVVDELYQETTIGLNAENFIGAISPSATQAIQSAQSNRYPQSVISQNGIKYAINGGVIVKNSAPTYKSTMSYTRAAYEVTELGDVELELTVKLKDMGIDVGQIQADAAFVISGSLNNLALTHLIDFDAGSGLNELDLKVTGDINLESKLNGNGSITLGYYHKAWKEVEDVTASLLGMTGKLTGLDRKDKIGKFPLVGLVWSTPCPQSCTTTLGSTQTPVNLAKYGGVIVWVYLDAAGNITLEGEFGARVNAGYSLGIEQPRYGDLDIHYSLTQNGDKRLIEMPFISGKVGFNARTGISLDVDAFALGVRLANASAQIAANFSTDIEGELSYGTDSLGEDWSWDGSACITTNYGAGLILSASANIGVQIDVPWLWDLEAGADFSYSYSGQWPSEEEIEIPGWHGMGDLTWYTADVVYKCFGVTDPSGDCGAYIAPGVWKEFDCYNLAAIGKTTNDDPFTPSWRLIGGYWQWGRKGPDASQRFNTNTPNFAHGPIGPSDSEANSESISGWDSSSAPDGAWSDSYKTANDPCPGGFRVPTITQWLGVLDNNIQSTIGSWSSSATNYSTARFYGSDLMLSYAGKRDYGFGMLFSRGVYGNYWSSSEYDSNNAWRLGFYTSTGPDDDIDYNNRRDGQTVRCVAEDESSKIVLSKTEVSLLNGDTETFSISGGTGYYSVSSDNTGIATAVLNGSNVEITGISTGTVTVTVEDTGGSSATIAITVASSSLGGLCGAYIAPGVWKEFDCYNLAAIGKTTNDDPFTPSWRLIGGYWQWGRKGPDPSQWYNTNTSNFVHGPTGPGYSEANSGGISGWYFSNPPDGAWSVSYKTVNDPCPWGFRVPTNAQWEGVQNNNTQSTVGTWSTTHDGYTNYSAARFFGNNLMLPAAGGRYASGEVYHRGKLGFYWSSLEISSDHAWYLLFGSGLARMDTTHRTLGLSVRCVAE